MGLLAASVSNSADIEDVEDDISNGIYTIPARFGILPTRVISGGLFLGSVYKSGIIPHAQKTGMGGRLSKRFNYKPVLSRMCLL